MNLLRSVAIAAIAVGTCVSLLSQDNYCSAQRYEGLPAAGREFPTPLSTWADWLKFDPKAPPPPNERPQTMRVSDIRRHAWWLWGQLTAPSQSTRPDVGQLPRWETWFPVEDVLRESIGNSSHALLTAFPRYEQPPELQRARAPRGRGSLSQISQESFYNRPLCEFVVNNQLGRDDVRNCLKGTAQHKVPDIADPTAMALKPVWFSVSSTSQECPQVPVWDGVPPEPKAPVNFSYFFPTVYVRLNPKQTCPSGAVTVDLDRFYYRKVLESPQVSSSSDPVDFGANDLQLLLGMHMITKEIPSWLWVTFWWHDRALSSDSPFAADRDGVDAVKGVWRNYLMDVAVDMDRPWQSDGQPKAAYNPYLEGQLNGGTRSNCMTCHSRASWPVPPDREALNSIGEQLGFRRLVVTGREAAKGAYFPEADRVLGLGFLWTLARPQTNPQPPLLLDAPISGISTRLSPACTPELKLRLAPLLNPR